MPLPYGTQTVTVKNPTHNPGPDGHLLQPSFPETLVIDGCMVSPATYRQIVFDFGLEDGNFYVVHADPEYDGLVSIEALVEWNGVDYSIKSAPRLREEIPELSHLLFVIGAP